MDGPLTQEPVNPTSAGHAPGRLDIFALLHQLAAAGATPTAEELAAAGAFTLDALRDHLTQHPLPEDMPAAAGLLAWYHEHQGDPARALHYARLAAERDLQAYAHASALRYYSEALRLLHTHPTQSDPSLEYELLEGRANAHRLIGERQAQLADLAAMAQIAETLQDIPRQIAVVNRQVTVANELGHHGEALRNAEIALALSRQISDRKLEADSLTSLGDVGFRLGQQTRPLEAHTRALTLYRELGDLLGVANSLRMLGRLAYRSGKYAEVSAYSEEALALYRQLRDRVGEAMMLNALGVISADRAKARDYYEQSLTIVQAIGDRTGEARAYNNLALIYWSLGLYLRARDYLEQAVQIERDLQGRANLTYYLESLGRVYLELGDYVASRQVFTEGSDLAFELGDRWTQSVYGIGLGRVALAEGQPAQAAELLRATAELLRETQSLGDLANAASWLALAYLQLGDGDAAYHSSTEAVAHLENAGNAGDYPPQDIWWHHYQVLQATSTPNPDEQWRVLQRAREAMLAGIATLSDEGLRRNYLNKVAINTAIVTEWARVAVLRAPEQPEAAAAPALEQDAITEAQQLRDRLKRALDVSRQMNELHDAAALFTFVMEQVIEMNGAERGFIALLTPEGKLHFPAVRGLTAHELATIEQQPGYAAAHEVLETRLPVLLQDVADAATPDATLATLQRRSVLCAPLLARSELLGLLYADNRSVSGCFSQADLDLLSIFANQAATAIENARLYQETTAWAHTLEERVHERTAELEAAYETLSRRARQLETSHQVGQQLTLLLDLEGLLEYVVSLIQSQFGYYFVGAWLINQREETVVLHAGAGAALGEAGYTLGYTMSLNAPHLIAEAARTGKEYVTPGSCALPEGPAPAPEICNEMLLPLYIGKQVLGILNIQSARQEDFDRDEQLVLQTLSHQISIIVRNAQLFSSEQRRRKLAESLEQAGREMSQSLHLSEVPGLILEQLAQVVPYTRCSIMLRHDAHTLHIVAQRGFPEGGRAEDVRIRIREDDVFLQMAETREPVLIDDVTQTPGWQIVPWLPLNKSWLGVPLISKSEMIGMISMTREAARDFDEDEAELVPAFAAQAAVALENARLYDELNRAYHNLERLNQTKSRFIEVTAHELRTPLAVIRGYAQLLGALPVVKDDPQVQPALAGILSGMTRMHDIVNSILDVTKIDSELLQLNRIPVYLCDVVKRVAGTFKADLQERDLTLQADLEGLPAVSGDPDQLFKVFHHLLINAIKYTPDGGSITVSGTVNAEERAVEVVVSDTGIGIDLEHQALIFEKFYQTGEVAVHSSGRTKFKGGGPGLGLAIAKGIVAAHGGAIWAHSDGYDEERCPGSHFYMRLPLAE